MQDLRYDTDDLICALATPWAPSALAVIRTTGKGCLAAVSRFFSRPRAILEAKGFTLLHGTLLDEKREPVDEVMISVFRAPASYTGQDSVEISCHGSLPGIRRIIDVLTTGGFRSAGPGEFTLRAFLNGKLDLTRAEAVQEIVAAKSSQAQSLALHRLSGSVETRVKAYQKKILDLIATLNIQLDYAEDDVENIEIPFVVLDGVKSGLESLAATYETGRVYQEGIRVVLAGKTNAGKSSLFNLFLKEDRSIVSDEHGTTRDWLESWVTVSGIPVRLFDTAGLREAENQVEQEGIRRSKEIIDAAEAILYLVDSSVGITDEDIEWQERLSGRSGLIRLWTKTDLQTSQATPDANWIALSAQTGNGFEALSEALRTVVLGQRTFEPGEPVIDSLRQKQLLDRAIEALKQVRMGLEMQVPLDMIALDVKDALDALGEITGEMTSADILEHMFSNFCVGK